MIYLLILLAVWVLLFLFSLEKGNQTQIDLLAVIGFILGIVTIGAAIIPAIYKFF